MNNDNQIYKIFRYETGGVYFFTLSYSGRFKKRWKLKVLSTSSHPLIPKSIEINHQFDIS